MNIQTGGIDLIKTSSEDVYFSDPDGCDKNYLLSEPFNMDGMSLQGSSLNSSFYYVDGLSAYYDLLPQEQLTRSLQVIGFATKRKDMPTVGVGKYVGIANGDLESKKREIPLRHGEARLAVNFNTGTVNAFIDQFRDTDVRVNITAMKVAQNGFDADNAIPD